MAKFDPVGGLTEGRVQRLRRRRLRTELFVEAANRAIMRFDVSVSDEERVGPIAWFPDGRVAFSVASLGDSNPTSGCSIPPRAARPERIPAKCGRRSAGIGRPPGLAVDSYCCTGFATDLIETEAVWSIDPETREHGHALVEGSRLRPALDRTGRRFLLVRVSPTGTGRASGSSC